MLNGVWLWITLILLHGTIMALLACFVSFISIGIMNTGDEKSIGISIGFSQACSSLTRAAGAASGGAIFGWSLNWDLQFPLNSQFSFLLIVLLLCVPLFVIEVLTDETIEKRKKTEIETPLLVVNKAN